MMGSKLKVVTHGYFPHQCTESHASVRVDRRYLGVFAVVSLTALDMMYALITLAHALGEKTLRIMSIFTQVINRLQKLKKNDAKSHNPTNILRKLSWSCICTGAASEIQFIYSEWVWGRTITGTHWVSTTCCQMTFLIPPSIRAVPFPMHWGRETFLFDLGHNILLNILMRNTDTSQRVWARMEWANALVLANGGSTLWSRNMARE